jgi:hypothetical protein
VAGASASVLDTTGRSITATRLATLGVFAVAAQKKNAT